MSREDSRAQGILIRVLLVYAAAYLAFAAAGGYVFIVKTVLIPAFAIYAVRSGEIALFVRSWFPFLAATILFDALRGAVYMLVQMGYRPIYAQYAITLEQWVTGTPALCIPLQESLRAPWLDRLMVVVHGAHFVYFLLFGLAVWHTRREWFARYKWSLIGVFYGGILCYALVPTAPPWMASQVLGLIPHVEHVASGIYNLAVPQLHRAFDTNPVAAMPSLHAALPAACMLIAWGAFRRTVAIAATVYTLLVGFSIVYLGEHYLVDVLAGYLFAGVVCAVVFRVDPAREPAPLRGALLWSAVMILLTVALAALGGR